MFPPRSAAGVRGTRITWNGVGLAARLSKDPGRLRQAWLFAAFAASPEAGRIVAQVQRSIPACRAAGQAFAAGSEPARAGKFIAAMEFSRLQPITLKWNDMDNALYNALGKLTIARRGDDGQCDVTPESTLDTMADAMVKRRLFPVRRPDGTLRPMEERP
jgi:ABC-type glycerol-3-phosphate transport system substrate-binding protein